jgi:adenylate kinase
LAESKENRVIIVVGIPGVGKSTIISTATKTLQSRGIEIAHITFGTLMYDMAKSKGIYTRDDIRGLAIDEQKELQRLTANAISSIKEPYVIVDTHLFINTVEGYYPGLPYDLLKIISPDHLVLISALPSDILSRRKNDLTRNRDVLGEQDIKNELNIAISMISACSILSGSPFTIIINEQDKVDKAAMTLSNLVKGVTK